jgi:hypothetical protein
VRRRRRSPQGKHGGAAHAPEVRRIVFAFLMAAALLTAALLWAIHRVAGGVRVGP